MRKKKNGHACGQAGFTLVEVLIVMAIVIILVVVMVGIIDPTALVNKGKDARRRKDMGRIKIAFEEYFNDRGCYPNAATINDLMLTINCGGSIFSPWLSSWPCDPNGISYFLAVEETVCPHWFKVFTKLENKNDADIPSGWEPTQHVGSMVHNYSGDQVNFGISSTNVWWYDFVLSELCESNCYYLVSNGRGGYSCSTAQGGCGGDNCYRNPDCMDICRVEGCP